MASRAAALPVVLLLGGLGALVAVASCGLDRAGGAPAETGAGAASTSSSGTGGGGALGPSPCQTEAECPGVDTTCRWRTCTANMCSYHDAGLGTPCTESSGKKCDGNGNCVQCLSADECALGSCTSGTQTGGETCQNGQCEPAGGLIDCAPYVCDGAGHNCLTDCSIGGDNDCVQGYWCNGQDECVNTALPDGAPCQSPTDCQSNFCVDDVCCGTECTAGCQGCSTATTGGTDGVCDNALPFTDPHGDCSEAIGCDDGGSCASCGFSLPNQGSCPSACDDCQNGTCNIACPGSNCSFPLTCPPGWQCDVSCEGNNACKGQTINCPDDHICKVHCTNNQHKCQNATIHCSLTGPCELDCQGGDTCEGAVLVCGANKCNLACNNLSNNKDPTLTDNNQSCSASPC